MNRRSVFFVVLALIWGFFLIKIGFNIFGIGFAIFFSVVWCAAFGAWFQGKNEFKRDQYFANKYDEEYKNK